MSYRCINAVLRYTRNHSKNANEKKGGRAIEDSQ